MGKTVLLGVTGSIASYKACALVGLFRKKGYKVRCVMSPCARHFVTRTALEVLSGQKVIDDMFCLPENRAPGHISLAEEADIVLIAPATADVIGKIAAGICDDILTCTVCSTDRPVLLAPAMNDKMYLNVIVQDKIEYLKEKGYFFVGPVKGHLACGREGIGHLAPLEKIVEQAENILVKQD